MKRTLTASLDRIEEGVAVFVSDDGETIRFQASLVPGATETGVYNLTVDGERLLSAEYLKDETEARLSRAEARLRRLFKNK